MGDCIAIFDPSTINLIVSYFVPFIVIFTIFYALLQRAKVFGDSTTAKRFSALLSASLALLVVVVNPLGISWVNFFANLSMGSLLIIIGLAVFVGATLMFSAARRDPAKKEQRVGWLSIIVGIIAAIVVLNISGIIETLAPSIAPPQIDYTTILPYALLLTVFAIVFGFGWLLSRTRQQ